MPSVREPAASTPPLSHRALEMQQQPSRWDYALEAMLILLIAAMAFAFGGRDEVGPDATITRVSAWTHEGLVVIAGVMALLLACRQIFQRDARFAWSWAYLPIGLFLLLAVLQLVPLPAAVVGALSPHTVHTKGQLLADLPNAAALMHAPTLTFYREATWQDLRKLLAVATVFVVVVNVYRRSMQVKRLLLAISIIGFLVALVAVHQNAFGSRMIYGIVPVYHPNSGPFLNHSHFGQFINLSIGAMLGLLLVKIGEITEGSRSLNDSLEVLRYARLNFAYVLGFMALLSALTVFLSLTRGGVASMLIAATVMATIYVWRRGTGSLGNVLFALALLVLLVVLYSGFGLVYERMATLRSVAVDNGGRMSLLADLSRIWRQFPIFGTGLGTHRYLFPMFDHATRLSIPNYAENEYAQLMEEAGAIGFVLCLAFVGIVAAAFVRCVWHHRRPVHLAAFGLGYGLLAILIHSASDFGQHDPVNFCLTATYAGLLIALARHARPVRSGRALAALARSQGVRVGWGVAAAAAVIAIFVLPVRTADAWRRARLDYVSSMPVQARLDTKGWNRGTNADYRALMLPMLDATKIEPHDAVMRYWLADFGWEAVDASRGNLDPKVWGEKVAGSVRRIVDELNLARADCPTYAPPCALAGQLDYFLLGRTDEGAKLIRTGYRLDPNEPIACLAVARLDAVQGNWPASIAMARRALTLDRRTVLPGLLTTYVQAHNEKGAYELVRGDRYGLDLLARMLENADAPADRALAEASRKESSDLLLAAAADPKADAGVLRDAAEVYVDRHQSAQAIECYRSALVKEYSNLGWHIRLANLLLESGKREEAIQQARDCLQLHADYQPALDLLNKVPEATTRE